MKIQLGILLSLCAWGQPPGTTPAQSSLSVSPQQSPFPLPRGIALYSGTVCGTTARVVSAGQIRQAIEAAGLSVQDPALNTGTLGHVSTPLNRLLNVTKYLAAGASVSSA